MKLGVIGKQLGSRSREMSVLTAAGQKVEVGHMIEKEELDMLLRSVEMRFSLCQSLGVS